MVTARRMTKKEWYENRKRNGLCVKCGQPADSNKVLCEKCAEKRAIYQKETREFRIKMGFCPVCGRNKLFGEERMCPECLAKNMETVKKSRETTGKTHMDYYREQQKRYKENNLCRTGCGRKRYNGMTYCEACLKKHRERGKKYKKEKVDGGIERSERQSYGLCYTCGKPLDREGGVCKKCAVKMASNLPTERGNKWWHEQNALLFKQGQKG